MVSWQNQRLEFFVKKSISYFSGHESKEVAFLHKPSKTLIEADLLFNLPAKEQVGTYYCGFWNTIWSAPSTLNPNLRARSLVLIYTHIAGSTTNSPIKPELIKSMFLCSLLICVQRFFRAMKRDVKTVFSASSIAGRTTGAICSDSYKNAVCSGDRKHYEYIQYIYDIPYLNTSILYYWPYPTNELWWSSSSSGELEGNTPQMQG